VPRACVHCALVTELGQHCGAQFVGPRRWEGDPQGDRKVQRFLDSQLLRWVVRCGRRWKRVERDPRGRQEAPARGVHSAHTAHAQCIDIYITSKIRHVYRT
jgi:hypothetical protein